MNTALADFIFEALSLQVHASFLQQCLCQPNIVFVEMFMWFVDHYGKTTVEDHEANRQQMAASWHPADGFDTLVRCLFTGTAFAGCTNFTLANCGIVNIVLRSIKQCGMYAKEYKAWIACKAIYPRIVKTFDSFKTFWVAKITLVNQTAIPASQYGYGMAATNNDDSVVSHGETILNFGAAYTATQESVKWQGTTITSMQNQLNPMSQYCMALQQQATLTNHASQHQHSASNSWCGLAQHNRNGGSSGGYQQPVYLQPGAMGQCLDYTPTPYKSNPGTTATLTVVMWTTGTPAGCVPNWAPCTIHMRQGPTA
jgi:hypothetical protein